jgi:hypothetical protein
LKTFNLETLEIDLYCGPNYELWANEIDSLLREKKLNLGLVEHTFLVRPRKSKFQIQKLENKSPHKKITFPQENIT